MTFLLLAIVAAMSVSVPSPVHAQQAASKAAQAEGSGEQATPAEIDTLIKALRDEKSRTKIIDALEKAAAENGEAKAEKPLDGETAVLGRRLAELTSSTAERIAGTVGTLASQIGNAPSRFSSLKSGQMTLFFSAIRDVALVIIATYAIFFVLRRLAIHLYRGMGNRAAESGVVRTIVLLVASTVIDVIVVALAWAAGYIVSLTVFGEFGIVSVRQSLYLNAFLLVELFKVALRFVLSPSTRDLRMIDIGDGAARLLNNRLTWIASLLGYGQLFVIPIFNRSVSLQAGQAIAVVLALIALIIAVVATLRHRAQVQHWLAVMTTERSKPPAVVRTVAGYWHVLILAYLAYLLYVILARPVEDLLPVLAKTGLVIVVFIAGLVLIGWLSRARRRGISLPDSLTTQLPLLESRLNAFVPRILSVIRVFIFVAIIGMVLDIAGLIDMRSWLDSETGLSATGAAVSVFVIVIVSFAVWLAMSSWVDYRLNPDVGTIPSSRERTLLTLLRNAITIGILVITLMFALSEVGINIAPLLASAGVIGLAVGFGAQKMVQDIITGVFIQLENAIDVGDVVTAGGITGVVERLTIRSVSLRDLDGTFHIIPFSSVDLVSNFMREFSYHVANMGIAYREDYDEARQAMFDAFADLKEDPDHKDVILGDLEWFGLQELGDSAVVLRARIKTLPGSQWGIGRAYNMYLKKVFDARGIEIPYPHQTIYFGEDKKGKAPPVHVAFARDRDTGEPLSPPSRKRRKKAPSEADSAPKTLDVPESDAE